MGATFVTASGVLPLQTDEWDCGPSVIMATLHLNGIKAKYKDIIEAAGTTPESGTLGEGIVRVLVQYGFGARVWNTKKLKEIRPFMGVRPLIVSVDKGNHWVLLLSMYKNSVVFFDPYYGTTICSLKKFTKRWRHSDGCLYAIDGGLDKNH
jgi:ABC-type bacteriocin/lantibiotic exporter with double-glycine peptidase domain